MILEMARVAPRPSFRLFLLALLGLQVALAAFAVFAKEALQAAAMLAVMGGLLLAGRARKRRRAEAILPGRPCCVT